MSLLICEVIVRYAFPVNEAMNKIYIADSVYATRTAPYLDFTYTDLDGRSLTIATNGYGHRWGEYDTASWRDTSVKKILLLGDSYTFGVAVNQHATFAYLVDSILNADKHIKSQYSIINAGVGGWCTKQELLYGIRHLNVFNPDIVVITFCPNDPIGDMVFENGFKHNTTTVAPDFWGKEFLRRYSHLYFIGASYLRRIKTTGSFVAALNGEADFKPFEVLDSAWVKTVAQYKDFYEIFKTYNPKGRLLIQTSHPWDEDLQKRFSELPKELNVEFVDLYDQTVTIPEYERRFPHDGHWSERIHRMSAEALSARIIIIQ